MTVFLSWIGCFIVFARLWKLKPRKPSSTTSANLTDFPLVSIVVPARNEEKNLPQLLSSLKNISYPNIEVVMVDDQSTDQTKTIASAYPVKVVSGEPLPPGWIGKNWACHQGFKHSRGAYLLFTDADTVHHPQSLKVALEFFIANQVDTMSALPYHQAKKFWEKLMGPFHALLYVVTRPSRPAPHRLFAIGQYLLFSRQFYETIGGHKAIADQYPDDLALARRCFAHGGRYRVFTNEILYSVRMYDSFMAAQFHCWHSAKQVWRDH